MNIGINQKGIIKGKEVLLSLTLHKTGRFEIEYCDNVHWCRCIPVLKESDIDIHRNRVDIEIDGTVFITEEIGSYMIDEEDEDYLVDLDKA
jgi:hypothetical protein